MSEAREYRQLPFSAPPGALDLLLVRHGASAPYVPGQPFALADGQGDPDLAPEGRVQAERVAARLAGMGIDAIYVTSLRRTVQTAEPLALLTGKVPVVEPGLREIMLGEWEGGLFRQRVAEGHPLAVQMIAEQRWAVIPGAEADEVFSARVRGAIVKMAAAHPDQRVVAFTHGGVIGQVMHQASGSDPFAFSAADNGSISQIVVLADRWSVRRFNDTAHLAGGLTTAETPPT
jgi:probable phosphoglycerate mutase